VVLTSREDQGATLRWKSVQRISGYQGYQPDISGIKNGSQEKLRQISIENLVDFSRIFKKYSLDITKY